MSYPVALINPPLVHSTGDLYGNIPFMPTGLLYLAGYLRDKGVEVRLIDGFGEAPKRRYRIDDRLSADGLTEDEIVERVHGEPVVGISVHSGMSHSIALRLARRVKDRHPSSVLVAGGNHASVLYKELLEGGFDYVCLGEGERVFFSLVEYLRDGEGTPTEIPGLACPGATPLPPEFEEDLDQFSFAAMDLLPLDNYWGIRMQHAPVQGRYAVITTSRGCVYNCRFCTTPQLLGRRWRTRSAKHVVDEMQTAVENYGVTDFIIQDELFGRRRDVSQELAEEILKRGMKVRLSLPSGIKVENMDEETLTLLHQAGLNYLVFAPESGSQRVLEKMQKPMDFDTLLQLAASAHRLKIKLSCVFVLGFEDETDEDRKLTRSLALRLTRMGVEEISLFIWSPLPGADAFESESGWSRYEELNWSPSWRASYPALVRFRGRLYLEWLLTKLLFHPLATIRSAWNVLTGRCELKSEMALRRMLQSRLPFLK
ncbi:MAG: B12-binding domain-containing radical SAM protein [bacterium]|nr:B12-binding domain-containing radical SAM protein [bacterium]